MHIPKTAGRSVSHAFEQALGEKQCAIFPSVPDVPGKRFVAGHFQLTDVPQAPFAFTFLREPIAQIASHLRWLDRYNLERFEHEAAPFSASILQAIRRAGETDFGSAASIGDFFDWLPAHSHARLVNVQCEVLAARAGTQAYRDVDGMAAAAIGNLALLDFVGVVERMHRDLPRLFRRLGLKRPVVSRQNTQSSPRRIELTDPAIRAVLARQVQADLVLYRHVMQRRWWAR